MALEELARASDDLELLELGVGCGRRCLLML